MSFGSIDIKLNRSATQRIIDRGMKLGKVYVRDARVHNYRPKRIPAATLRWCQLTPYLSGRRLRAEDEAYEGCWHWISEQVKLAPVITSDWHKPA